MKRFILSCLAGSLLLLPAVAQSSFEDELFAKFSNPDKSFSPRVWWHWMNGNITMDGIRKDLLWMDRAGIAGFHNFDAGLSTPQIVDRRLVYMTPEWKEAFNYALDLADSLDMEVTIASSPGWSITCGPWVTEDDAEKKVVWREMDIEGGQAYKGPLPEPYINSGPYQDICGYPGEPHKFEYYRDLYVIAVKVSDSESAFKDIKPKITTSDNSLAASTLLDVELNTPCSIHPDGEGYTWVDYAYDEPQTIKAVQFVETFNWFESGASTQEPLLLEASDDGINYRLVLDELPISTGSVCYIRALDIPPTTARHFRFRTVNKDKTLAVSEVSLYAGTIVNMGPEKSGLFTTYTIGDKYPTPESDDFTGMKDVIDITSRYKDGTLSWNVPQGHWKIYRFGYNLLGRRNAPASPEATGLEVDKLDKEAVKRYYKNYLDMYQEASGGRLGSVIKYLMIDSYESGKGNWMADMEHEFRQRRGYSLKKWMPALAGRVIGSAEETERFLFDWRMTLGELMAENHYDVVNEILAPYGMKRHTESHEERTAFVGDGMMVKRKADIPMSAIWARYRAGWHSSYPTAEADVRESSSVAHIYGQNICAAESFTTNGKIGKWDGYGAYQCAPYNLKPLADAAMALGLNRFVIHCSVHQPSDEKIPGLGLGVYGQWFNRHDTWAEEARTWTDYLRRSCFMLQQGKWAADIAYFYGEDKNVTARFFDERVDIPQGYNFDFVNADILQNVFKTDGNALVTDSGMRYRMLVIDGQVKYMSMPVLRRIARFAKAGVAIYGPKPSLIAGRQGRQRRFDRIASRIWSRNNVFTGPSLKDALAEAGIAPDVIWETGDGADIRYVHRKLDCGDLYWIANITPEYRDLEVSLRATGKKPHIWHADTILREDASYRFEDGRTLVQLEMVPDDALFILLTEDTDVSGYTVPASYENTLMTLDGTWDIAFQEGRGAPASARLPHLEPLSESAVEGIRYFSGTASYTKTFEYYPHDTETSVWIDLGEVHHMARVFLNGVDLGLAWKEPYKVDASKAIKAGANELEVRVTDSWANRLIGDERKSPEDRITYTATQFYTAEDNPIPSGLVGPVRLTERH